MRASFRFVLPALLALGLLSPGPAQAAEGRYIVKYREGRNGRSAVAQAGGRVVLDLPDAAAARLPEAALQALSRHPAIEFIEPDRRRLPTAQTVPYGIDLVQAPAAWEGAGVGPAGVKVCVVDSGIDLGHEDLPATVTGDGTDWDLDGCGHGTHVAGTIAALDNRSGVVGVHGGVALHVVRIFNDQCDPAWSSSLVAAVRLCRDAGARVVNMSLGGPYGSEYEATAFQELYERDGMLLVAAAGNDGNTDYSYPASYDAVVSVAAVDRERRLAGFSQQNEQVELAAPGVSVRSTYPGDRYALMSGTSMATPHVAGAAALVWSHAPEWSSTRIREALTATAEDLGPPGRDDGFGHGLVQAADALQYLTPPAPEDRTPPALSLAPIEDGQAPGAPVPVSVTVADTGEVASVRLFHRAGDAGPFASVDMLPRTGDRWAAEIPADVVTLAGVDFYVEAVDAAGNAAQAPDGGPEAPARFTVVAPDLTPPAIAHVPPAGPIPEGATLEVAAVLTDPSGVAGGALHWRQGDGPWESAALVAAGDGTWAGRVPAEAVLAPSVSYRFTAEDAWGNLGALPTDGAEFTVAVLAEADAEELPPTPEEPPAPPEADGTTEADAPSEAGQTPPVPPDPPAGEQDASVPEGTGGGCASTSGGGAGLGGWLVLGLLAAGSGTRRRWSRDRP